MGVTWLQLAKRGLSYGEFRNWNYFDNKTGVWVKGGYPLCPSDISPKYDNENLGGGFNS